MDEELRQKLAAIEHERWADWQKWCHKVLRENCPSPELEAVLERWDRQIATPYSELSDEEKASDMEQVDRYWALIASYSREARINEILKMRVVGDKVAAQASPSFEELATAYDNHILKRAADLTEASSEPEGKPNE